jgi:hypothetical protein
MGQLRVLARYLVDAIGLNKIQAGRSSRLKSSKD